MPLDALALALAAAALHALWNLILVGLAGPRGRDRRRAALSPCCRSRRSPRRRGASRLQAWPFVAVSSALEVAYFVALAHAYRRADLSLVYPLARGLAPVLVLVVSVAFLGFGTRPARWSALHSSASGSCSSAAPRPGHGRTSRSRCSSPRRRDRRVHARRPLRRAAREPALLRRARADRAGGRLSACSSASRGRGPGCARRPSAPALAMLGAYGLRSRRCGWRRRRRSQRCASRASSSPCCSPRRC